MRGLPAGWDLTELGNIVEILDSHRVPVNAKERALRPGDVPYYGATGQVGWIDEALFDEDLVLLGEDGAPFLDPGKQKAYRVSGPSWVNNHAHVLRVRSDASNGRFLKYALDAADYRPHVNGTTRLKLTQKSMCKISIPLPPRAEQERIVAAIDEHLSRVDAAGASSSYRRWGGHPVPERLPPSRRYFQRSARGIAGSMPKISQPVVEATKIPLPPLVRQRSIVRRLSDDLTIALRMAAELKRSAAGMRSLRRAILTAAFSGKLVPQDPDDEPASVLLERIQRTAGRGHPTMRTRAQAVPVTPAVTNAHPATMICPACAGGKA